MNQTLRILIVDDSTNLRQVIKRYLKVGITAEFFEASDGAVADGVIQEQFVMGSPIDVVMLDWMMPNFSGLDFLKKIRTTPGFEKEPAIIMLTAETYSEQINACMKYGVSSYITKPFTQEQLVEAVHKAIRDREMKHAV
jgi:DNA-binding response OmpR family regulator